MPSTPNLTVTGLVTVEPSAGSRIMTLAPGGEGVRSEASGAGAAFSAIGAGVSLAASGFIASAVFSAVLELSSPHAASESASRVAARANLMGGLRLGLH